MSVPIKVKETFRKILQSSLKYPWANRWIETIGVWIGHRHPKEGTLLSHVCAEIAAGLDQTIWAQRRVATLRGGFRLLVEYVYEYRAVYFYGLYEEDASAFVRRWLRPGDVFLDVGTNIGYYTCLGAKVVGECGEVHSFEPNPEVLAMLETSLKINGFRERVRINKVAVGATDQTGMMLYLNPAYSKAGSNSLLRQNWVSEAASIPVDMVSLDSYCFSHGIDHLRLLKIDVEGWEKEVISGAQRTLQDIRPEAIICEVAKVIREDATDIVGILDGEGYEPYSFNGDGSLSPWDGQTQDSFNLCFLPTETKVRNRETLNNGYC